jgi:hypothetical protein
MELDAPLEAIVTSFSQADRIGRLRVEQSGEELKFGASACRDFEPTVGERVFVTAVGAHPLGGRRAESVRCEAITEKDARERAEAQERDRAARAEDEAQRRRGEAEPVTTAAAITQRVIDSVMPEEGDDADEAALYALVDDLEAVGPNLWHASAILRGIALSDPLAHFGNPGPLVHYVETLPRYDELLFRAADGVPRAHFVWMLVRIVNADAPGSERAQEILRKYVDDSSTPPELRDRVSSFLAGV